MSHQFRNVNDDDALLRLTEWMRAHEGMAIAFSGGMDSSVLLAAAQRAVPEGFKAFFVDLPYISDRQRREALETAEKMGVDLTVIPTARMEFSAVHRNDRGRCYHCKALIFDAIAEAMDAEGLNHIVDGENSADKTDTRPGRVAARERGVLSPMADLSIGREDVERIVKDLGLPVRMSKETCLATRLEADAPWDEDMLRNVEKAEEFLHDIGISQSRVRVHGQDARIEVPPEDMPLVTEMSRKVHTRLRELGFRHVSLDLKGYRTGSMWE